MLTEELRTAARALGEALHGSRAVLAYFKASPDCEADPEAVGLEKRLLALYEELIARQQRGEILQRSEIDAFNALRRQVYEHPRIADREAAMTLVKPHFAEIADEINLPLGVEFAALAQAAETKEQP
jgi:cell fate (sporulation/competence/biofilm development) regulator YlbF (YheA/YmcA/DUF963 family)